MHKRLVFLMLLLGLAPSVGRADDKDTGDGNLRYTVTVAKFENKASWSHARYTWGDLTQAWTEMMTHALNQSGHFTVIAESDMRGEAMKEQDFAAGDRAVKGRKNPGKGRMATAQVLVKGAVTHVADKTSGGSAGINLGAIRVGGSSSKTEVNILVEMVDAGTGIVVASKTVKGRSGQSTLSLRNLPLSGSLDTFQKDNLGQACQDAVDKAVEFLQDQLEAVIWEGTVVVARANRITINRGEREGLRVGQVFSVGDAEEIVDPDTGEVLDVDLVQVGRVEVIEVKGKIAYCKPLAGTGEIRKGMTVVPDRS